MNIPGLITCHKAEVALAARRMVTHGTVPDEITLAVDGSKLIIGVTTLVAASAASRSAKSAAVLGVFLFGSTLVSSAYASGEID